METNCPSCAQRLRVPDGLANPLLRCRNCGSTFRLQDAAPPVRTATVSRGDPFAAQPHVSSPAANDEQLEEFLATQRSKTTSESERANSFNKGTLGTIALVIGLFVLKGGGRLARHFMDDRAPQQPVPVRVDDEHRQGVDHMMQDLQQQIAGEQVHPQPVPIRFADEHRQNVQRMMQEVEQQIAREQAQRDQFAPPVVLPQVPPPVRVP